MQSAQDLTTLDYFAARALQGLIALYGVAGKNNVENLRQSTKDQQELAGLAYAIAGHLRDISEKRQR